MAPRVLVLRPGALGDALVAVPALRALRHHFHGHHITFAAHPAIARLLADLGEVDEALSFDDPVVGSYLRGAGPGVAVMIAWLGDPEGRLTAWMTVNGVRGVVAPSRPPNAGEHVALHLLRTLGPLGISPGALDDRPLVRASSSAERRDMVVVHPGSGAVRKNWPARCFAATVDLLRRRGFTIRLLQGEADDQVVREVQAGLQAPVDVLLQPSIETLLHELADCRAYLGNDSGVSHLAGLSGCATYALFGPTRASLWRPLGPRVRVLPFGTHPEALVRAVERDAAQTGDGWPIG